MSIRKGGPLGAGHGYDGYSSADDIEIMVGNTTEGGLGFGWIDGEEGGGLPEQLLTQVAGEVRGEEGGGHGGRGGVRGEGGVNQVAGEVTSLAAYNETIWTGSRHIGVLFFRPCTQKSWGQGIGCILSGC